ncbi:MAG: hypothetical protein JNL38_26285 [Myxococcales bacterium]|nr:hypothetical protein [Myxococcales bacterium]
MTRAQSSLLRHAVACGAAALSCLSPRAAAADDEAARLPQYVLSFESAVPLFDMRTGRADVRGRSVRTNALAAGVGEGLPRAYDAPLRRGFDWHPRGTSLTVGAGLSASSIGLYEPPRCNCEVWDQSGSYLHGQLRVGTLSRDGNMVVWPRAGLAYSSFELRDGTRSTHGHQVALTAEVGVYYAVSDAAAIGVRGSGRFPVHASGDTRDGEGPVVADTRGFGAGAAVDLLVGLDGITRARGGPTHRPTWLLELDRTAPLIAYRFDLGASDDRRPPLALGTPMPWDIDHLAAPRFALHRLLGRFTLGLGAGGWVARRETELAVIRESLAAASAHVGVLTPIPILEKVYFWPRAVASVLALEGGQGETRRAREAWVGVEPALAYFLHPSILIALGVSSDLRLVRDSDGPPRREPMTVRLGSSFRVALAF